MKNLKKKHALYTSAACLALSCTHNAYAADYQFNNGVEIRFDNTVQYSVLERTAPESSVLAANVNSNDGDNNLRAGIVSNRFDLLTKVDISYNGFGFDTTVDSFYDTVYNQHTQNSDAFTYNPAQEPPDKFTSATRTQAGRNIELRNLFIYGSHTVGGVPVTVRVGRLVNLFGESLLFPLNGISYGQAPIDIERAVSVPNTQAKDLFLPVGQALVTAQLTDAVSVSAYYQFEWEKFNAPPAGSYFGATADILDAGGQRILAQSVAQPGNPIFPYGANAYFYRGPDQSGADTGQFGIAVHYDPEGSPYDFGLYALQYNDSEPQVYARVNGLPPTPVFVAGTAPGSPTAFSIGSYQLVYPDHIQIYGASASTTVGPTNVAGEISVRTHEPLNSSVTVLPGENANNSNAPLYAIGNTLHYQASAVYLGPKNELWGGSTVLAEVAGDNLLGFTKNRDNFNRTYRHMALGFRAIATANYYEVLPGVDVNPSIGLGWNFMGRAPDTVAFNNYGIDRGGDITFGVAATYLAVWNAAINYTRFIAPPGRDLFADRDFVAFSVERTF